MAVNDAPTLIFHLKGRYRYCASTLFVVDAKFNTGTNLNGTNVTTLTAHTILLSKDSLELINIELIFTDHLCAIQHMSPTYRR